MRILRRSVLTLLALALAAATSCGFELSAHGQQATAARATPKSNLEPYLKESFADLAAQVKDDSTPLIIRRRAIPRLASRYPDDAPDALVPLLYQPGGHLNEYTAEVLFRLGRPNSKADELAASIGQGRSRWTLEQIVAFSQALAWPGNKPAVATLQRMIDDQWDTANWARLCIARIEDTDGPKALLRLPAYASGPGENYRSGVDYAQQVGRLLRFTASPKTNDALLAGGSPAAALALWGEGLGIYAVAWPGNKALAEAYLAAKEPYTRFHIAAARTRDPRCLKAIRQAFEKEAAAFLAAKPETRHAGAFIWICIAGVEAADGETAPTLMKLLAAVEDTHRAAEAAMRAAAARGQAKWQITDRLGGIREIILRGLCVNPLSRTSQIVGPYLPRADGPIDNWGQFAAIAMLRAGHPEGLEYLLKRWSRNPEQVVEEAFLIYSGTDVLSKNRGTSQSVAEKAMAWYHANKDRPALRQHVADVNAAGLWQSLVESIMLWP